MNRLAYTFAEQRPLYVLLDEMKKKSDKEGKH